MVCNLEVDLRGSLLSSLQGSPDLKNHSAESRVPPGIFAQQPLRAEQIGSIQTAPF